MDVKVATNSIAAKIKNWRVEVIETLSDHQYIQFEITGTGRGGKNVYRKKYINLIECKGA